ncbi:MAG: helix-turn-helix transcriptional regulator [Acidimicrobiales bacterium]
MTPAPSGRPPSTPGPRLGRLLAMVPWLLEEGGASVTDIARRFGVAETEVVHDLALVGLCGVPPYGGGDLIDVWIDDDDFVHAYPGPFFTRPMQLSPAEGFAVLAAGRALAAVPGADRSGALARALAKLEAALGQATLSVELAVPDQLPMVRDAVETGARLAVRYYSAWRDEVTEREIDPCLVHSAEGQWYLEAFCHRAGGMRRFRVDRLQSVVPTGEHFEAQDPPAPTALFAAGPDTRSLVVSLPASARWAVEAAPTLTLEAAPTLTLEAAPAVTVEDKPDGRLRATLPVAGTAFVERLLLRLGPDAEVLEPAEHRATGRDVAARLLARYREPTSPDRS